MNLIKKIKNQSGVLVGIFAVAMLFAFLLSSGEALKIFSVLGQGDVESVGKVAGRNISKHDYESNLKGTRRSQEASNDVESESLIQDQAWNALVQQIILHKEFENIGILVTDREAVDIVQGGHIHPWIKSLSLFVNKATNLFDKAILIEFLQNLAKRPKEERVSWYLFERSIIESRKQEKFLQLLGKTFYKTRLDVEVANILKNIELTVSYVYIPYSSFTGETQTPNDDDVRAYIEKHKSVYKKEDSLRVKYLTFKVEPAREDIEDFTQRLNEICDGFYAAKDDYAFAIKNTDGPTQSVKIAFNSQTVPAILEEEDLKVGKVIGPVDFGDIYRLYKVTSLQKKNGFTEYEVTVIEKAQYLGEASRNAAYNYASKCASACKSLADLERWALEHAYPIEELYVKKNNTKLRGKENAREVIRWLFNNKVGHVSHVCEIGNNYIVAVAIEEIGSGASSMHRYRDDVIRKLQNESKMKFITNMLNFDESATMPEISNKIQLKNFLVENQKIGFTTEFLPRAGIAIRTVGAAFDLREGERRIVADDYGVFVLQLIHKDVIKRDDLGNLETIIEKKQADMELYSSLDAMLELANVVDCRYKFY